MPETITGVHPAADVWPMLDEANLRRLADDIKANGLNYPITLDGEGRVIAGRNRLAACRIAGVEPIFETRADVNPATFVLSENNERQHMTTGQRAAAAAMTLATDGQRVNGRWKRGSLPATSGSGSSEWPKRVAEAGVVLDHAPELLPAVAAGTRSLDAAYKTASEIRETAKRRAELPDDLGALVDAGQLDLADALRRAALPPDYADRVADGSVTLDEAETLSTRDQREHKDAVRRQVTRVLNFLDGWSAVYHLPNDPLRGDVLAELSDFDRGRLLQIEEETKWPSTLT